MKKFLDDEAPKLLSHVTGVERTIADQLLGVARAAVEADNNPELYDVAVTINGHCMSDGVEQKAQVVHLTVNVIQKDVQPVAPPEPEPVEP